MAGPITQLIGQNLAQGMQDSLAENQQTMQQLGMLGYLVQDPKAPPAIRQKAKEDVLGLIEKHGGKEAKQNLPQFAQYINTLATKKDQMAKVQQATQAQATAADVAEAMQPFANQSMPIAGTSQDATGRSSIPEAMQPFLNFRNRDSFQPVLAPLAGATPAAAPAGGFSAAGPGYSAVRPAAPPAARAAQTPPPAAAPPQPQPANVMAMLAGMMPQPQQPKHPRLMKLADALAGFGGGVTGNYPPWFQAQQQRQANQVAFNDQMGRLRQAAQQGLITPQQFQEGVRYLLTGERESATTSEAEKLDLYRRERDFQNELRQQEITRKVKAIEDQRKNLVDLGYSKKEIDQMELEAQLGQTVKPPSATTARGQWEVISGTDPHLQAFAKDTGLVLDNSKSYRVQFDPSGKMTAAYQAGSTASSTDRTKWGQYFKSAQSMYPDITREEQANLASEWMMQRENIQVGREQQRIFMDEALSGVGPGPGLTMPPKTPVAPATTPPPAPVKPTSKKSVEGQLEKKLGPEPIIRVDPDAIRKGARAAPLTPAAPGARVTPQDQHFVEMYLNSISRVGGTGARGGAAGLGILRGQKALEKMTGLDPVSLNVVAGSYQANMKALQAAVEQRGATDRLIQQIDVFGKQFLDNAAKIKDAGAEFWNTPLRTLVPKFQANPQLRQYLLSAQPLQRAYTAMSSGAAQSRAQLPVATAEHVDKLINPNITLGEAVAEVQQLKLEGAGDMKALLNQQHDIQTEIYNNPIGRALGAKPAAGTPGAPAKPSSKTADEYFKNHPELLPQ